MAFLPTCDYRVVTDSVGSRWTGPLMAFVGFPRRRPLSGSSSIHYPLLFPGPSITTLTRLACVAIFVSRPRLSTARGDDLLKLSVRGGADIRRCRFGCMLTVINGGFSQTRPLRTLSLFRSARFSPPHCYQCFSGLASSVLHANLPPSAPFPLGLVGLLRFGFLMPVGDFLRIRAGGLPWVRLYNLPTYRPPAHRFD